MPAPVVERGDFELRRETRRYPEDRRYHAVRFAVRGEHVIVDDGCGSFIHETRPSARARWRSLRKQGYKRA